MHFVCLYVVKQLAWFRRYSQYLNNINNNNEYNNKYYDNDCYRETYYLYTRLELNDIMQEGVTIGLICHLACHKKPSYVNG